MKNLLFSYFALLIFLSSCQKSPPNSNMTTLSMQGAEKVFSFYRLSDPKSLDPQAQLDSVSGSFVQSIYDTLLSYHYLKRPYQLEPVLLSSMPEISEDGKKLSFTLREGVYFHDNACFKGGKGREVTSDDVLYSIKRFADININTLSWFMLDGVVLGLDELRNESKTNRNIDYSTYEVSGLKKIDRYKFSIEVKQKNPLLLYALAASPLSIIPKEAVDKYGRFFSRNPVGTGAYQLEKYRKKQTMTLVKNQKYFLRYPSTGNKGDAELGLLDKADQKLPFIDKVLIHYIPESQPRMLKFKKGELAWVDLDRDNFQQMAFFDKSGKIQLKKELDEKFNLYNEAGLSMSYLVFNLQDKILQNKNLRKAIAHAMDTQKKIDLLDNGRGVKLHGMVPPSIPGSEREIGQFGFDYDLAKAKAYLKKAGYGPDKKRLELTITLPGTGTNLQNLFEFLRNSFDILGIDLKADYKTWPSYLKATEIGDFQVAYSRWQADYPDPENFYMLLYGPNQPPGQNSASFNHPEYNKLYEEMRFMENGPKRNEIIKKMAKILQEEIPVVFESAPLVTGLIQDWVLNFKRNIMLDESFKYFDVQQKTKS